MNGFEVIGFDFGIVIVLMGFIECDGGCLVEIYLGDFVWLGVFVFFDVVDDGLGLMFEVIVNMFDFFFLIKENGCGFGFLMVFGIVKVYEGVI